jgi:1-acyl-sn-glycerol-3-phosphate acyltransferase
MGGKWGRRALTIPSVVVAFALVTLALPLLLAIAALVDVARWLLRRQRWTSLRLLAFLWVYLAAQVVGLSALFWVWLLSFGAAARRAGRLVDWTFEVQQIWASALFRTVCVLFGLRVRVEGEADLRHGPYVVFIRHASVIDTLLPTVLITRRHGIRLRFVLKRELLVDPCLDVAGLRLPNCFVSRAGETSADVDGVATLGRGLGPGEGVLIYPEGTRFSPGKRRRILARLSGGSPEIFSRAQRLSQVLPPRLGGALALLEAAEGADAVFFAHAGLDGFASVRDIFDQALGARRVEVKVWRIPRSQIPRDEAARVRFLYDEWQKVDEWIAARTRDAL